MSININNLGGDDLARSVELVANHIGNGYSFEHEGESLKLVEPSLLQKIAKFIPFRRRDSVIPEKKVLQDLRVILLRANEGGLSETQKEKLDVIRTFCDRILAATGGNGPQEIGKASIERMPRDVLTGIVAPHLESKDLISLSEASETIKSKMAPILDRAWVEAIASITIGPEQWNEYYGLEIKDPPEVPQNIEARLKELAKEGKLETEKLILIPAGVSLRKMEQLARNPKNGNAIGYRSTDPELMEKHWDEELQNPYWVLMKMEVLPDSKSGYITREMQLKMAKEFKKGYDAPTLLEAVILNFVTYAATRKLLFSDEPWDYTVCQEEPIEGWKLVVGGFASAGLALFMSPNRDCVGVAPVLRSF